MSFSHLAEDTGMLIFPISMQLTTVVIVVCKTGDPVLSKSLWLRATLHSALFPGVIICQPIIPTLTTVSHVCVSIAAMRAVRTSD